MTKQRVTAFIDPILVKRAKVRGAVEGLTISEIVERALDEYAPDIDSLIPIITKTVKVRKHTKHLIIPR